MNTNPSFPRGISKRRILRAGIATLLGSSVALLLSSHSAMAVAAVWNVAGDGVANTASNWLNSTLPGVATADSVTFNNAGVNANENIYLNGNQDWGGNLYFNNTGTTTLLGGTSGAGATNTLVINNITINAGAGAVTIGQTGALVNLLMDATTTTGYTNNSSNVLTINGTINISSASRPIVFAGSGDINVVGGLTGAGTGGREFFKYGTGTLTIRAASSTNTSTIQSSISGGLTLTDAGTLTGVTTGGFGIRRGGTILLDNSGTSNVASRLADTAPIASAFGGGTFSFKGADNAASSETVAALNPASGVLTVNSTKGTGSGTSTLTFASLSAHTTGATLNFTGASLGTDGTNKIVFTAGPTLSNNIIGGYATVGNEFATYNQDGSGAANTNGVQAVADASYSGSFAAGNNVKLTLGGSLGTAANTLNLQTASGQAFTVDSTLAVGAILNSNSGSGTNSISGGSISNGTGELVVIVNSDLSIASVLSDNGALTKSGAGTLTLSGAGATRTTANVFITAGTLKVTVDNALYDTTGTATGTITVGYNSTLELAANTLWTDTGKMPGVKLSDFGATFRVSGGSTFNYDRSITLATLTSSNTTIAASLEAASFNLNAATSADTINLTQPIQVLTASSGSGLININGAGTVIIGGSASNSVANTLALNGYYSWDVTGGGKLLVTSTGTNPLGITGRSVKVTSGTLGLGSDNTTNYAYTLAGGTLSGAGGGTRTINASSTMTLSANSSIDLKDAAVGATANMNLAYAGSISGSGGLTVAASGTGTGTLTLSGSSSFSGGTTITGGILALGNATNTLNDTGAVAVSGGELSIGANSDTVGAVTLNSGSITGTTGTLTGSSYAVKSGTISAKLGGAAAGLTKSTSGTVTLSGVSGYAGATALNAGALILSGSLTGTSSLTVGDLANLATSAVLSGSGSVSSAVTVGAADGNTGAAVDPGNGAASVSGGVVTGNGVTGILNTGAFTLTSGAHMALQLGGTTAGTSYDQIVATGVTLAGDLQGSLINGYTPAANDLLFVVINSGVSAVSGAFSGIAQGDIVTISGQPFQVSYNADSTSNQFSSVSGNDVALLAVPEPGAFASLLGGMVALLGFGRRRRTAAGL